MSLLVTFISSDTISFGFHLGSHGVRSSQCHCFLNMAYSYAQMKTDSAMQRCDESYLHALQAAKDTGRFT